MKCDVCEENDCVESFGKNANKCLKCNSIYNISLQDDEIPAIVSGTNNLKLSAQRKNSKLVAQSYLKYLKEKTNLDFENSLDIGCGFGDFVEELNKIGTKATGIESDKNTVQEANSNVNYGVFNESYDATIKYDLISINQTLYYFEDSFAIIKKISELLKPNGIIMIATINTESSFRQEHEIWTQGCKMCLGNKLWENFDRFGLNCIDVTSYDDNLYIDFFLNKAKILSNAKFLKNSFFYLSKIKKLFVIKNDGINNFIFLKKSRLDS